MTACILYVFKKLPRKLLGLCKTKQNSSNHGVVHEEKATLLFHHGLDVHEFYEFSKGRSCKLGYMNLEANTYNVGPLR
jgi:hypothetical protein